MNVAGTSEIVKVCGRRPRRAPRRHHGAAIRKPSQKRSSTRRSAFDPGADMDALHFAAVDRASTIDVLAPCAFELQNKIGSENKAWCLET
jgi:hypothetical protein